jgi:hypothetical protein
MCLIHDHDLERRPWHLKIHAAIAIHLDRGIKIELGERNLFCGLIVKHPEHSTGDRVIVHFFHVLVAENQRRRRFGIQFARPHTLLQPIDFTIQLSEVTLRSAVVAVRRWRWTIVRTGVRGIRILIVSIVKRICIPAVIGVIPRVWRIPASSVETSGVLISNPNTNPGTARETSTAKSGR